MAEERRSKDLFHSTELQTQCESKRKGNADTKHVRLIWGGTSGQIKCRVLPVDRFHKFVIEHGVGLHACAVAMPVLGGIAEGSGLTSAGEVRLVPDLSTKHPLPWCPEHEIVLANMHEVPGTIWEYCPRGTLQRLLNILEHEFNLGVRAGFENEFYLLKPSREGWQGIDKTRYCSSSAFERAKHILDEIYDSLKLLDIEVEQMHAESGQGQFEITVNHYPALTAADNVLFVRETVKSIANKHHLLATFMPKYFYNDVASGLHVHLSLWHGGKNILTDENSQNGMSKVGEEFLAGVLHHLPSILVFTAPHPNSYTRLGPNTWTGAYQCWGNSNREAALCTLGSPGMPKNAVTNFEFRPFDGMSNPHLGLTAIVAAGIDGLRKHLVLPEEIGVNPATLSEGTVPRLPANLNEAVTALQSNDELRTLIGEKLVKAICAMRLADIELDRKNATSPEKLLDRLVEIF